MRNAWKDLSALIAGRQSVAGHPVHGPTYLAVSYAAADDSEVLNQIERDLDRLEEIGGAYFDNMFTRHVSHRLRRDAVAAGMVRDAIMSPTTPDARAAQLVSLLAEAVGLDEDLLFEVERRIAAQSEVRLAPVVRDHAAPATLSIRTIFTRIADASLDVRST